MSAPTQRQHRALSITEAFGLSPSLARLGQIAQTSAHCLERILPLIPPGLRASVQAGPIEDGVWCLLVDSNATAAKIRQLVPNLQERLRTEGLGPSAIRLRVRKGPRG